MLTCICKQNVIKIYHVVEELRASLLIGYRLMDGRMDGRTESNSDYSASRNNKISMRVASGWIYFQKHNHFI